LKKFLEKKYVNTGFVIALAILLSINILTYLNTSRHFQDEKYQTLALQTMQTSEALLTSLTQVETSRRGYLITNEDAFLQEYYSAIKSLDTTFGVLKKFANDDPLEIQIIDTLAPLIHDRKDVLQESLELQENKDRGMKVQIEYTSKGKESQDHIKNLIHAVQSRENEVLKMRFAEADLSSRYTLTNLIVGTSIAFVLLILSITLLNRNITQRKIFEKDLEESRNWLYTTLTSIADAVIVTDNLGGIMFTNSVALKLTGWDEKTANGMYINHVFNIIDEETREEIDSPVLQSLKSGKISSPERNVILVNKVRAEIPIDLSAAPIKDNDLRTIGTVLVFRDVSVKRKAERDLRNSQRFVERIAESIPNILYVYNLSGPSIIYANFKISELLGFGAEEIKQMGSVFFSKYIHPDDLKRLASLYQRFMRAKDNDVLDYEYRVMNSRGEWRWMHSYDVVFKRGSDGLAVQLLGTAQDVTDRKKLEDELKKYSGHLEELVDIRTRELKLTNEKIKQEISERAKAEKNIIDAEEKFRSLVEHSLAGIYILQNNRFVYVNPRFEEIFDSKFAELEKINPLDLVLEDDKPFVIENIEKLFSNKMVSVQYTYRALRKKGTTIIVEVRATKIDYMGSSALIGTMQDVTERKLAEDEIRSQQEFLRTVIDLSPSLIFAKDREGRFTLVNKSVAELYGTTVDELIGKTDKDFNISNNEVQSFIEADRLVIDNQQERDIPEEMVSSAVTGETRWYQTKKIPLIARDGSRQVLGVSSDITARKVAEEMTIKSLKEKELLLQEIHHRVKNNLQIIVSLLKLQSKHIYDQRDLEIFNNSRARVETMSLIHEKLYKSKDISSINFDTYIRELASYLLKAYKVQQEDIELLINANNVKLGIDTAIPCGLIINELVINILKFAFPEGRKGRIEITVIKDNDDMTLIVSDNGIGLAPDFSLGESISLGLQLVDTLIKQLDGNVVVDKADGAKFTIKFKEVKYKERI